MTPRTTTGARLDAGITLKEVLLLLALVILVVVLFLPGSGARLDYRGAELSARCKSKLRDLFEGVSIYLRDNERHLPPAWHVDGDALADDLGNLTAYRLLVHEEIDPRFKHVVSTRDVVRHQSDRLAARQEKFLLNARFWKCPASGWTSDYFAPDLLFPLPPSASGPAERYRRLDDLAHAAAEQPLLADVNASVPRPQAIDVDDPAHEAELRAGFRTVRESDLDIFVGAGPSLRDPADPKASRFDPRHCKKTFLRERWTNVLFLDGHVDSIAEEDEEALRRVHARWNPPVAPPGKDAAPTPPEGKAAPGEGQP
jgi:prepilin-type processing-associated H-X9-DG protein